MSKLPIGFTLSKAVAYLGRFTREAVLRAGHNTTDEERIAEMQRKRDEALKRSQEALPGRDNTIGVSPIDRRGPKFGVPEKKRRD